MNNAAESVYLDRPTISASASSCPKGSCVVVEPTRPDLEQVFALKYGPPDTHGWGPRMRARFGYFTPDEVYEAVVTRLIGPGGAWLDVGCGRDIFPSNQPLAQILANRCGLLVGVDPDDNIDDNPFVHARFKGRVDDFRTDQTFDVVTLRMVAEHIADPQSTVASLARLTRPGGYVVVYTVNRRTPVALAARLIPFGLHHSIKRVLWDTEKKDTFPVTYRMNTRRCLSRHLEAAGFEELYFSHLGDCRTFGRFRVPHYLELSLWHALRAVGLRYPENCLLGVYCRSVAAATPAGPGET